MGGSASSQAGQQESPPLRVGLVGCGAVARDVHLPALEGLDGVEVTGIADADRERARALAEEFGVPFFADASSLLKDGAPDVVHVLTRPESHAELATAALEAGCHVLVEKPFVYSSAEARTVLELARSRSRRVSVVHNYLHHPSVALLRERVAEGDVGEVCSVHFMHGRRDQRYVPDPWYFQTRGGRLGETLPHALYLLTAFLPDLSVRWAEARKLGHVRVPEHSRALDPGADELRVELSGPDGTHASVLYSLNATIAQSLIVTGTKATLQAMLGQNEAVYRWSPGGPNSSELLEMAQGWLVARLERRLRRRAAARSQRDTPHARQIRAFIESLREGDDPPVTEADALRVVQLWEDAVSRYADGAGGAGAAEAEA
ncbi:MAG: Gfo/Idh/MocA family protein [Myxococcota bacterium]